MADRIYAPRVYLNESVVHSHRRDGAFCSCGDYHLNSPARISRRIQPGDARRGHLITLDAAVLLAKLATKLLCELRPLVLAWRKEKDRTLQQRAIGKTDSCELLIRAFKPG